MAGKSGYRVPLLARRMLPCARGARGRSFAGSIGGGAAPFAPCIAPQGPSVSRTLECVTHTSLVSRLRAFPAAPAPPRPRSHAWRNRHVVGTPPLANGKCCLASLRAPVRGGLRARRALVPPVPPSARARLSRARCAFRVHWQRWWGAAPPAPCSGPREASVSRTLRPSCAAARACRASALPPPCDARVTCVVCKTRAYGKCVRRPVVRGCDACSPTSRG